MRSDALHPSAPRPHFCSFSSFCGILEQDRRYFPANFAIFKVLWNPHFKLETFLTVVGRLSLSNSGGRTMPVPLSPSPWKARGGGGLPSPAGSELTSPCLFSSFLFSFLPSFSDPCPLSPRVFPSGCSKSHSVSGIYCLCSKVNENASLTLLLSTSCSWLE